MNFHFSKSDQGLFSLSSWVIRPMLLAVFLLFISNFAFGQNDSGESVESVKPTPPALEKSRFEASQVTSLKSQLQPKDRFRIGEKLSYSIEFGKFPNAGYAETVVASRGKIGGVEAIELRTNVKTLNIVSAAFFTLDEFRSVFASPETGFPLQIVRSSSGGGFPKQTVESFIKAPATQYDLLTLIFKARELGGNGTLPLLEGEQASFVTFSPSGTETIKTDAGVFETVISTVTSEFLTANGIKEMKISFSTDEHHIPVMFRIKTTKGEFKGLLSAITVPQAPQPTPTPLATPMPATPKPTPTPEIYVENRPLAPELGFQIGELLEYRISSAGRQFASLTMNVRDRKKTVSRGSDDENLQLVATISGVQSGQTVFQLGNNAVAMVDPETLAPRSTTTNFGSTTLGLNQTLTFDKRTGMVTFGGDTPIDAPVGTHTLVSLFYAMRSFNLKLSKDPSNPVNDTRVAVFWESKPLIFTLRPSESQDLTINGEIVPAQMITFKTGDATLDAAQIKVWIGTEDRVPVKFTFGQFVAELVSRSSNLSQ